MDIQVWPILLPNVDFRVLLDMCNSHLPTSPVRKIDEAGMNPKTMVGYLQILESIQRSKADPIRTLWMDNAVFSQISLSFIVAAAPQILTGVAFRYKTVISENRNIAIFHATLGHLFQTVNFDCQEHNELAFRVLANKIVLLLEQAGFGELWHNFRKNMLLDGTFIIESVAWQ